MILRGRSNFSERLSIAGKNVIDEMIIFINDDIQPFPAGGASPEVGNKGPHKISRLGIELCLKLPVREPELRIPV